MGEIAGERSQVGISDVGAGRRLRAVQPEGSASRVGRGAVVAGDAFVLATVLALFAWASSAPSGLALLGFGVVTFILLRVGAPRLIRRRFLEFAWVMLATGLAAAITLVLWSAPMVGLGISLREAALAWSITTVALLLARLVVAGTASRAWMIAIARRSDAALKRVFDVVLAAAILVLTAPIGLVVALAIWIDDRGPVFYRCDRVGAHGRRLRLVKFRKMRTDAAGPRLTSVDDARFTRVGRFLARSKLDEWPQLWNVLRGQMSLVGPRPEDPEFVEVYPAEFAEIASVRPGVTGLCQLAFAKESEIIDEDDPVQAYMAHYLPQKLRIDRLYVEQRTFFFDMKILFWTALVLLRKDVAVHRETGELSIRRRRDLAESTSRAA